MDAVTDPPKHGHLSLVTTRMVGWAVLVALPLVGLSSLMLLMSIYRISPSPSVEGSSGNPLGLLTSNFVYDGSVNVENVVASSAFLIVVFMYLPSTLRIASAYLLPFVAIVVGAFAQLTAISSVYVTPRICGTACSFYGMSGVSNAVIGFTLASLLVCLGLTVFVRKGRLVTRQEPLLSLARSRDQIILFAAFVVYVSLLLLFAGLLALPFHHAVQSGVGGQSITVPPPAILTQPPPTALVHAASIVYGFAFSLAIAITVNRRYGVFTSPRSPGPVLAPPQGRRRVD